MSKPLLAVAAGTKPKKDDAYEIRENKGFFVIITVTDPDYDFRIDGSNVDCSAQFKEVTVGFDLLKLVFPCGCIWYRLQVCCRAKKKAELCNHFAFSSY